MSTFELHRHTGGGGEMVDGSDGSSDPAEFEDLAMEMGWSFREIARRLNIGDATVRQWSNGRRTMPPTVLPWLRRVAATVRAQGLPDGWRQVDGRSVRGYGDQA